MRQRTRSNSLFVRALWLSLLVNGLIAAADLGTAPAHGHGRAQGVLGYVNGTAHLLQLPGLTASSVADLRPKHLWTWRAFWAGLAVNAIVYTGLFTAWGRLARRFAGATVEAPKGSSADPDSAGTPKGSGTAPRAEPVCSAPTGSTAVCGPDRAPAVSRRMLLLLGSGRLAAGGAAACGSYGFFVESRWFEVTRHTHPVTGLPPELDRLRIVHLSDIHHGAWMDIEWVRRIIDVSNALAPDLALLTGDYVYRGLEYVRPVAREIARLRPRIGTLGVMGNHDWWQDGLLCKQAFAAERVPLIDNARRFVTLDRRLVSRPRHMGFGAPPPATAALCVAGVGDLWEDKCLYDAALGGVPGGMPRILLAHNPDVAEEPDFLRAGHRVDLMLAGHTHGGQVRIPGLGTPVTNSRLGPKYASGWVQGPACTVFVSKGLGMTAMPVRFGVRPEIALIELRRA